MTLIDIYDVVSVDFTQLNKNSTICMAGTLFIQILYVFTKITNATARPVILDLYVKKTVLIILYKDNLNLFL